MVALPCFEELSFGFRAGKPPTGMHLDVSKNDKLVEVHYVNFSVVCLTLNL